MGNPVPSEIVAFTAEHVCKLTGLSMRQLRYWDQTEFFSPTIVEGVPRRTFGRIYSFSDVVGLRTIAVLRDRVPLQVLRRVGAWLRANEPHYEAPWAELRFALSGRKVAFIEPTSGVAKEASGGGQIIIAVTISRVVTAMRRAADGLRKRSREQVGRIERHRYVIHNRAVVAGTRIPTEAIWNFHRAGYRTRAIIEEFPRLKPADIRAAIEFEEGRKAA